VKPLPTSTRSPVRRFAVGLVASVSLFTIAIFILMGSLTTGLLRDESLAESRSFADLIIAARAWNAEMGGVYVPTSDRVKTNPYLIELGIDPDDSLTDGTPVTLRNPAAMTREIGEVLRRSDRGVDFKLTSLDPVNPDNAPDPWERKGLNALERGRTEVWSDPASDDMREGFRYMRALRVDESCLPCHAASGYQVGDIRGALSIRQSYAATELAIERNRMRLALTASIVLLGILIAALVATRWLEKQLAEANRRLELMANTDTLTGLWSRRYMFERLTQELESARRQGHAVGIMLIDVDHFKRINDRFGHAAGDEVLRRISSTLKDAVRTYDIAGRVGGEELLVISPGIDSEPLAALAERVRALIEVADVCNQCADESPTVSIGTALARPQQHEEDPDSFMARADAAMYAAKAAGRNRVAHG
jgi:diguanylate cyclase (GGDEF)-like protein